MRATHVLFLVLVSLAALACGFVAFMEAGGAAEGWGEFRFEELVGEDSRRPFLGFLGLTLLLPIPWVAGRRGASAEA